MRLSHEDALRLTQIYTPEALRYRLDAFVPSATDEQRQSRREHAQREVIRITSWQAANDDEEQTDD